MFVNKLFGKIISEPDRYCKRRHVLGPRRHPDVPGLATSTPRTSRTIATRGNGSNDTRFQNDISTSYPSGHPRETALLGNRWHPFPTPSGGRKIEATVAHGRARYSIVEGLKGSKEATTEPQNRAVRSCINSRESRPGLMRPHYAKCGQLGSERRCALQRGPPYGRGRYNPMQIAMLTASRNPVRFWTRSSDLSRGDFFCRAFALGDRTGAI
ncbi:hypothetical protein ZHAS_00021586 [Anopheles sinensis]|uniref:Uncharacterized protein n=1 Tax=Anopheles sinensis TaxID=74873 RepID=A0A084WST7_ANOSI|nr:hypothetical protein ZHAS_00021586 [Anopheles sinensis]